MQKCSLWKSLRRFFIKLFIPNKLERDNLWEKQWRRQVYQNPVYLSFPSDFFFEKMTRCKNTGRERRPLSFFFRSTYYSSLLLGKLSIFSRAPLLGPIWEIDGSQSFIVFAPLGYRKCQESTNLERLTTKTWHFSVAICLTIWPWISLSFEKGEEEQEGRTKKVLGD